MILISFFIIGCCDDKQESGIRVLGEWEWRQSCCGFAGHTITPQSEGYTKVLRITNTTFSEYQGDSLIFQSLYVFSSDTLFGQPEYIKFETGGAFGVEFSNGRMMLIEFCDDCYIHEYVRS